LDQDRCSTSAFVLDAEDRDKEACLVFLDVKKGCRVKWYSLYSPADGRPEYIYGVIVCPKGIQ
jgi:hypothetical protein